MIFGRSILLKELVLCFLYRECFLQGCKCFTVFLFLLILRNCLCAQTHFEKNKNITVQLQYSIKPPFCFLVISLLESGLLIDGETQVFQTILRINYIIYFARKKIENLSKQKYKIWCNANVDSKTRSQK